MNRDIMRAAGLGKQVDRVEAGLCPICGKKIIVDESWSKIGLAELRISGMCQVCQNVTFTGEE